MHERLAHKQTAVMLTLMALAREVSNPDLRQLAGLELVGKDRERLNKAKFVASRKVGRALAHELTDSGRAWCHAELREAAPPPPTRDSMLAAMYVMFGALSAFADREGVSVAGMFVPRQVEDIETRIRDAYRKLAHAPREWVGLVDLRPLLGGAPDDEVNDVLKRLSRSGEARLVPESNRKALKAADHAAAVSIGGEDNHLLSMEAS